MKKILPFDKNSVITSYPHYAFMCSMIQTKPDGLKWIYQTYTQISGYFAVSGNDSYRDMRLGFYPGAGMGDGDLWNICPFIDKMVIPRKYILQQTKHINFIRSWINKGWYLSLYIDQFFRDDIDKLGVLYHPLFIYGFDDEKEVLYCADCFEGWQYATKEVSYADFETASRQDYPTDNSMYGIQCYKLKDFTVDGYNIDFFEQQMTDYIKGTDNMNKDYYYMTQFPTGRMLYDDENSYGTYEYGISSYDLMLQVIEEYQSGRYPWDIKFALTPDFRLIVDRANLMYNRLLYLISIDLLKEDNKLLNKLKEHIDEAKILENTFLKFTMSFKSKTLEKAKEKFKVYVKNDIDLSMEILELIERSKK